MEYGTDSLVGNNDDFDSGNRIVGSSMNDDFSRDDIDLNEEYED
jgi:hypothetical protein